MGMPMEWPMQIWVDNEQAVVFQKGTCVNSKLKGTFDMRLQTVDRGTESGQHSTRGEG